jgi:D-inositol-3-phosphate glycosyltransferase
LKISIVTTEYGNSGGVQTVVDFIAAAIESHTDWALNIVSLRMARNAPESGQLLAPRTWRSERTRVDSRNGRTVHYIGASIAEFEALRYRPRRWLDEILDGADAVVVVAGTPAVAVAVGRLSAPVVLQVATMAKFERLEALKKAKLAARAYRWVMMKVVSRLDVAGLAIPKLVLVENRQMLEESGSQGARSVQLLAPGVDTSEFVPHIRSDEAPYILMIGRLADPRKNVGALIRSYALARSDHRVTHRLVLGGLTEPSAQEIHLIAELGLAEHIDIHSPVSRADLVGLYQDADVFVSASLEEGLGLTYLEAMACNVPIVTTDTAGAAYILGEGPDAGSIVPHGADFEVRFAAEISRWCHDPVLREAAGAAARRLAETKFSKDAASQSFVDAIRLSAVSRPAS